MRISLNSWKTVSFPGRNQLQGVCEDLTMVEAIERGNWMGCSVHVLVFEQWSCRSIGQCTSDTNPLNSVLHLEGFYCSVHLLFEFHIARQYFISGFELRCYRLCCPECDYYYYYYYYHHHYYYYYRLCCPVRNCHCIECVVRFVTVYRVCCPVRYCQCIEYVDLFVTVSVQSKLSGTWLSVYRVSCPVRDCQCTEYVVRYVTVSVQSMLSRTLLSVYRVRCPVRYC